MKLSYQPPALVLLFEVMSFHVAQVGLELFSLGFLSTRVTDKTHYAQPHFSFIAHSDYNLSFADFSLLILSAGFSTDDIYRK